MSKRRSKKTGDSVSNIEENNSGAEESTSMPEQTTDESSPKIEENTIVSEQAVAEVSSPKIEENASTPEQETINKEEKKMSTWKEKVGKFFKGVASAANKFVGWFKANVSPQLMEFLDANKGLAMKIVLNVAKNMASASNAEKRQAALDQIGKDILTEVPNLQVPEHWMSLLLEIAVAALKASGKI